jgi:hypothetical protein
LTLPGKLRRLFLAVIGGVEINRSALKWWLKYRPKPTSAAWSRLVVTAYTITPVGSNPVHATRVSWAWVCTTGTFINIAAPWSRDGWTWTVTRVTMAFVGAKGVYTSRKCYGELVLLLFG